MQETKLLGTLLPSSPDFLPIVRRLREKYGLDELAPGDEPITEIFLNGERVALEDFWQEIKSLAEASMELLPPELGKLVSQARAFDREPVNMVTLESLPDEYKNGLNQLFAMGRKIAAFIATSVDPFYEGIADMLYTYLLTGETDEVPGDWMSRVATISAFGEQSVLVMASQVADPDVVVQEFRKEYSKAFGPYHPRIRPLMVSTGYYMRLQRQGKPWDFIVEEFLRLNNLPPQSDRSSKAWKTYSKRLRRRIERYEPVLSVLVGDRKRGDPVA